MTETARSITVTAAHRDVLGQVLDKWSIHVLEELCVHPRRFNELRRVIPVSQKSLTTTLRRLERNGIVERRVIGLRPVAVEYRITALGKTLREPVEAVLRWSEEQMSSVQAARRRFDEEDGAPMRRHTSDGGGPSRGDLDRGDLDPAVAAPGQ